MAPIYGFCPYLDRAARLRDRQEGEKPAGGRELLAEEEGRGYKRRAKRSCQKQLNYITYKKQPLIILYEFFMGMGVDCFWWVVL